MTDHKCTDGDVIKALELCFTPAGTTKTCAKCPFHTITLCKIERDRAALDLLHRQKAQIIKEQNKNSKLRNERNHLKAEIDDLKRDTIPKLQNALERANYYGLKADEEIEHLKVEIEALKIANEKMYSANKEQEAEIEKLKGQKRVLVLFWKEENKKLKAAKSEAIKEFAENLTQDFKNHRLEMNLNGLKGTHRTDEMTYETIIEYIDNLVKEMTEGKV